MRTTPPSTTKGKAGGARTKAQAQGTALYRKFQTRLRTLKVLDPACGSGNFLYVVLKELKSLEKEAILWAAEELNVPIEIPQVGPEVVHGIELNPYAAELARVTVWIGELQWMISNGFGYARNPILRPLDTIECRDAILDFTSKGEPIRAAWPGSEFVVGNPPFLGRQPMREDLGDEYVDNLWTAWDTDVPREADLVCYWHEKARELIATGEVKRAGLLATQAIRFGANRKVLDRVKDTGDIFMAWAGQVRAHARAGGAHARFAHQPQWASELGRHPAVGQRARHPPSLCCRSGYVGAQKETSAEWMPWNHHEALSRLQVGQGTGRELRHGSR